MADNTPQNGSATIATNERTIAATAVQVQRIELLAGTNCSIGQVAATNTATLIKAATETRRQVTFVNRQLVPVYMGDSNAVTTSTGFRLDPGDSMTVVCVGDMYGITAAAYTASSDDKVHFWEVSAP